jgi:hypothetical protein
MRKEYMMEHDEIIIKFDPKKGEVTGVTFDGTAGKLKGNFKQGNTIELKTIMNISEITALYIEQSPGHWCIVNRRKFWCP